MAEPNEPNELAAAMAALGQAQRPFVYVVTLKSGVSLTHASPLPPPKLMQAVVEARAAPDLLDAARQILREHTMSQVEASAAWSALHAAVAKAEGGGVVKWIDGDGTFADEIADIMYAPPA